MQQVRVEYSASRGRARDAEGAHGTRQQQREKRCWLVFTSMARAGSARSRFARYDCIRPHLGVVDAEPSGGGAIVYSRSHKLSITLWLQCQGPAARSSSRRIEPVLRVPVILQVTDFIVQGRRGRQCRNPPRVEPNLLVDADEP